MAVLRDMYERGFDMQIRWARSCGDKGGGAMHALPGAAAAGPVEAPADVPQLRLVDTASWPHASQRPLTLAALTAVQSSGRQAAAALLALNQPCCQQAAGGPPLLPCQCGGHRPCCRTCRAGGGASASCSALLLLTRPTSSPSTTLHSTTRRMGATETCWSQLHARGCSPLASRPAWGFPGGQAQLARCKWVRRWLAAGEGRPRRGCSTHCPHQAAWPYWVLQCGSRIRNLCVARPTAAAAAAAAADKLTHVCGC
jgi:hypothetical protein